MNIHGSSRVRRSLDDLQDDYAKGNTKPLEDLMRAWKGIKDLPPTDPKSFFALGGLHGEPFRGAGGGATRIGVAIVITATSCSLPGTACTC